MNKSWPIALKINLFSLSHLDHVNYHDAYIDAYTITIKNKETEGYTISRFSTLPYPFSLSPNKVSSVRNDALRSYPVYRKCNRM